MRDGEIDRCCASKGSRRSRTRRPGDGSGAGAAGSGRAHWSALLLLLVASTPPTPIVPSRAGNTFVAEAFLVGAITTRPLLTVYLRSSGSLFWRRPHLLEEDGRRRSYRELPLPAACKREMISRSSHRRRGLTSSSSAQERDVSDGSSPSSPTAVSPPKRRHGRANVSYVRPSAAIERGSGFYVPGLEGEKIRLAVGTVLLGACLLQLIQLRQQASTAPVEQDPALILAAVYSCLVLVQSGIELARDSAQRERRKSRERKDDDGVSSEEPEPPSEPATRDAEASSSSSEGSGSCWATGSDGLIAAIFTDAAAGDDNNASSKGVEEWKDRVEWIAATYLSLTAARRMLLVRDDRLVFDSGGQPARVGGEGPSAAATATASTAFRSAIQTLQRSTAGRVALPDAHPTFRYILRATKGRQSDGPSSRGSPAAAIRTVLLQRVDADTCWVVTSSELLAAFPRQDLALLGQLAAYLLS